MKLEQLPLRDIELDKKIVRVVTPYILEYSEVKDLVQDIFAVYKEKINLVRYLSRPGIAIVNKADIILSKLSGIRSTPVFFFGINCESDFKATEITYKPKGISFLFRGGGLRGNFKFPLGKRANR